MSGYSEGGANRRSKVLKMWNPLSLSAGSDIDLNYELLKNRAADLARNSPLGQAAITTSARGVIGSGLKLFARPNHRVLGITTEEARAWSRRVTDEFELWAGSPACDLCRRNNFYDLQHIAYVSYLTEGDVFCVFRRSAPTPRNPYTLRLQMIEAARVSTPTTGDVYKYNPVEGRAPNGNKIINGIETDESGAQAAIWISNRVPNDLVNREARTEWVRVSVLDEESGYPNVLQISHDERAGQYRGVPYLSSVIETLKQISRFTTAELSSAIVRSFFSLFFIQPLNNYDVNEILGKVPEPDLDLEEYKLGSGTLNALPRGVDVKTIDSGQSQSVFREFTEALVTQIGAALSIPKEVLLCSFNASYSASRAALLQFNDEAKRRRAWFVRDFLKPIYEVWLTEAIGLGRIEAPGYFDDALKASAWGVSEWYGPALSVLDPVKEMQASKMRLELGLTTLQKEAAELTGTNWERNKDQQETERSDWVGDNGNGRDRGMDDASI